MEFKFIVINYTPLHLASISGSAKIVGILLSHKEIDVNLKAILKSKTLMIKFFYLKKLWSWIITFYYTPLYLAVKNDKLDIVKLLLENEAIDVNSKAVSHVII